MKHLMVALLLCGVVACDDKKKDEAAEAKSDAPASKINKESVGAASDLVKRDADGNMPPLEEAVAKVTELLGESTSKTDEEMAWASVNGDTCVQFRLVLQDGKLIGTAGGSANKMIAEKFEQCKKRAGG